MTRDTRIDFYFKALLLGWLAFPVCGVLMPTVQGWKNVFYVSLLLPWLLLLPCILRNQKIWSTPSIIITLVLLSYLAVCTLWADVPFASLLFYHFKLAVYIIAFISSGMILIERYPQLLDWTKIVIIISCSVSLIISTYCYVMRHSPYGFTEIGWGYRFEGIGVLKNPIVAAQVYSILCLLCTHAVLNTKKNVYKITLILIAIVSMIVVFWTRSRGPSAFLLVALAMVFLKNNNGSRKAEIIFLVCSLALLSLMAFLLPDIREILFNRGLSIDRRMMIWTELFSRAMQTPVFGQGAIKLLDVNIGTTIYHHAHSIWLQSFLYGGVIAVLLSAIHVIACLVSIKRTPDSIVLIAWFVFGVLCLSINGHYLLSRPGWQWMTYWVPIAYIMAYSHAEKIQLCRDNKISKNE